MGHLVTSFLLPTGWSLSYLLLEPGLMPHSLSLPAPVPLVSQHLYLLYSSTNAFEGGLLLTSLPCLRHLRKPRLHQLRLLKLFSNPQLIGSLPYNHLNFAHIENPNCYLVPLKCHHNGIDESILKYVFLEVRVLAKILAIATARTFKSTAWSTGAATVTGTARTLKYSQNTIALGTCTKPILIAMAVGG